MKRSCDIETYINPRAKDHILKKEDFKLGNVKDPEKVKAKIAEKQQAEIEGAALKWWYGQIVCVSLVSPNNESVCFSFKGRDGDDKAKERGVLVDFFNHLEGLPGIEFIGHKFTDFDRPYLIGRAMYHDIGIPMALRPSTEKRVVEVDHLFTYSKSSGQITSLANYAFGLGISGKMGKGSDVAAWVEADQWDLIEEYCIQDAQIVNEIFRRYNKIYTGG